MLKRFVPIVAAATLIAMPAGPALASSHRADGRGPAARPSRHVPGAPAASAATSVPNLPAAAGRPTGVVWQRGQAARPAAGNMQYHGGPVQRGPQVYIVLWGSWWDCSGSGCTNPGSGHGDAVESYLFNYWHGVGTATDGLVQVNSQYGDASGGHPAFGSGVWGTACGSDGNNNCGWVADQQDPPQSPTVGDIAGAALWGADYFGVTGDSNVQIIVVSPKGIHPDGFPNSGFCAWHSSTTDAFGNVVAYTNMPFLPDAGSACDAAGSMDGWSVVGGHEFSETVTDPELTAWCGGNTASCSGSSAEIGDLCAWTNLFTEPLVTGSFVQQPLWDNSTGSCQDAFRGPIRSFNHRGKCVDDHHSSTANGTKVDIYGCNGTRAQTWASFPDRSLRRYGGYGHADTGKCLDIAGKHSSNGTKVDLWTCTGGWNQKWLYRPGSHEWYNPHSSKCLEDPSGNLTNGTQLKTWACNGHSDEVWTNV